MMVHDSAWSWQDGDLPPHMQAFRSTGVWRDRPLGDIARDRAMSFPDATVLVGPTGKKLLESVVADAEALAIGLFDLGLRPNDVISFQLPNWDECVVINLAAAMAGLVINPIVPIYRDEEVTQMLLGCGSKALFLTPNFRGYDYTAMMERISGKLPELTHQIIVRGDGAVSYDILIAAGRGRTPNMSAVDPDRVKLLLYTSGTTGRPKAVLHNHNSMARFIDASTRNWSVAPGEGILMPSPVTHITGYSFGLEMPFLSGSQTLLMDVWNAELAVSLIDSHRVVGMITATPFLQELVQAAHLAETRLPSLRFFGCGGAAVPPELIFKANRQFEQHPAFRVFGCSELPIITQGWLGVENAQLAASTDGEIVDYDVKVVDVNGNTLPFGDEGEILARGPSMFLGYKDPADNNEAITSDGYFRTGDLGIITSENALLITGRKKDIIIRGGENISAKEIEDVLHLNPDVAEVAIVSMPHPRLGEGVCAFIVPREGHNPSISDVSAFVAGQGLSRQKIPEHLVIVEALPKTASGKIRKDVLRAQIREIILDAAKST